MKARFLTIGLLMPLIGATSVFANKFDGSSPLLCAATYTVSCDSVGDCTDGPADAINLPVFMQFDAEKNEVITAKEGDERRTSKILGVDNQGGALSFVGFEPTGSWNATIDKETGDLTVSAAVSGKGYLIFGACIKR